MRDESESDSLYVPKPTRGILPFFLIVDAGWYELFRSSYRTPEEQLMLSVLYDGIKEAVRGADEARRWIKIPDWGRGPTMTFDFICEHFKIDAGRLRKVLLKRRRRKQTLTMIRRFV